MENLQQLFHIHFEWVALTGGLLMLAWMDPYSNQEVSLCFFEAFNIYCPGKGLGHSISFIFRGLWSEAWNSHPAGYLAFIVITWRIYSIISRRFSTKLTDIKYG